MEKDEEKRGETEFKVAVSGSHIEQLILDSVSAKI